MVHSRFRRFGHFCSINKFSIKWHWLTSTASNRKSAKIYFMILTKKTFFQNIKIKLKLNAWMTLKSSVVIFKALKPLQPQWPLWPQWPQWPQQPYFIKKFTDPDELIIPITQMTNTSPFLWNRSSKFFHWYLIFFLSEAVEASQCYFFEKWLMKHKCPNLLNPLCTIIR